MFRFRFPAIVCIALLFQLTALSYATEQTDVTGVRNRARALENGEGIASNAAEAVRLYCQAAQAGDAEALYRLGWIYATGKGVKRDDYTAALFFSQAAALDHPQSIKMLTITGKRTAESSPCLSSNETEDEDHAYSDKQRPWANLIKRLAPEYGIAPRLALSLAVVESNLNPHAVSSKNAQGLMQLIPETAERFNVRKRFDPEQNIRGGLAYLRWLLAYFQGDLRLVAAAYNAGEGAVNRYLGVPPYPETRSYVAAILSGYKELKHPFDASVTPPSPYLPKIAHKHVRKDS